jgi:hypothetical protein
MTEHIQQIIDHLTADIESKETFPRPSPSSLPIFLHIGTRANREKPISARTIADDLKIHVEIVNRCLQQIPYLMKWYDSPVRLKRREPGKHSVGRSGFLYWITVEA